MEELIDQLLVIAEDYLEKYALEGYVETVDQTYNDLYFQAIGIFENAGGLTSYLRGQFDEQVIRHFSPESLANLISLLKAARLFYTTQPAAQDAFWQFLHPAVTRLAQQRFDRGFYADAVVTCFKEANHLLKIYVKEKIGQELDGAPLMTRAFSSQNPVIRFADLDTENGRNIQLGYMKIFEGAMIGIRNPKSHQNMFPNKDITIHLLFQASFLFVKLQECGVIPEEAGVDA